MSDSAHLRLWLCILILLLSACGGSASSGGGNGPGGTNLVDVAIVYETKMQVYDDDRLRAASLKAIEEANRIFRNSGSKTRLRLVAVRPVSYTSHRNYITDVEWIESSSEINGIRKAYGADLVSMIAFEQEPTALGRGRLNGFATVVHYNAFVADRFTFCHEICHNLGAHHHDGFESSHGQTVMAVNGFLRRLGYLSNASVTHYGTSMGSHHHDARSIVDKQSARTVGFRRAVSAPQGALSISLTDNDVDCVVDITGGSSAVRAVHFVKNGVLMAKDETAPYQAAFYDLHIGQHNFSAYAETQVGGFYPIAGDSLMVSGAVQDWNLRSLGTAVDVVATKIASDHYMLSATTQWGVATNLDNAAFLYQAVSGDFTFECQMNNANGHNTGICIRAGLESGAPAERWTSFSGWGAFSGRFRSDMYAPLLNLSTNLTGLWCRIERDGGNIIFSESLDGTTWTEVRRVGDFMPQTVYVGCMSDMPVGGLYPIVEFQGLSITLPSTIIAVPN